jgi:AcrR family transcriptional regulator
VDAEHDDRRVRRTRRLLREALLALVLEKGYDKVTVQDVLDRADFGRATFYAHFRDKDDLLVSGLGEIREGLREQLAAFVRSHGRPTGEGLELTRVLFEHAGQNRPVYRALVGKRAGALILNRAHEELATLFREHIEDIIANTGVQPVVPPEVLVQYVVSALLGLLTWWLDTEPAYTAEQMSRMLLRVTRSGVAGALGAPSPGS